MTSTSYPKNLYISLFGSNSYSKVVRRKTLKVLRVETWESDGSCTYVTDEGPFGESTSGCVYDREGHMVETLIHSGETCPPWTVSEYRFGFMVYPKAA